MLAAIRKSDQIARYEQFIFNGNVLSTNCFKHDNGHVVFTIALRLSDVSFSHRSVYIPAVSKHLVCDTLSEQCPGAWIKKRKKVQHDKIEHRSQLSQVSNNSAS